MVIQDGIQQANAKICSFLIIGQSNMAGRGDFDEVPPIKNKNCYMLRMGRWQPMAEPINPDRAIFGSPFHSGVCLAASFANAYANANGVKVGLIPCADGGTSLDEWMPGQLLYDHAVMQTKLALRTSQLKAILWHQGESDCLCGETVAAYREKFLRMISQLRKDLGAENVPVILGELPQQMGANWKTGGREQQLNAILRQLAKEVPGCAIASSAGLSMKADGAHFDSPACREFGKRYFEAYQTLL